MEECERRRARPDEAQSLLGTLNARVLSGLLGKKRKLTDESAAFLDPSVKLASEKDGSRVSVRLALNPLDTR